MFSIPLPYFSELVVSVVSSIFAEKLLEWIHALVVVFRTNIEMSLYDSKQVATVNEIFGENLFSKFLKAKICFKRSNKFLKIMFCLMSAVELIKVKIWHAHRALENIARGTWKNLTWMLSIIICMYLLSFTNFEVCFVILFNNEVSKNAQKHEIVW